jgi:hypothetical protein
VAVAVEDVTGYMKGHKHGWSVTKCLLQVLAAGDTAATTGGRLVPSFHGPPRTGDREPCSGESRALMGQGARGPSSYCQTPGTWPSGRVVPKFTGSWAQ